MNGNADFYRKTILPNQGNYLNIERKGYEEIEFEDVGDNI